MKQQNKQVDTRLYRASAHKENYSIIPKQPEHFNSVV